MQLKKLYRDLSVADQIEAEDLIEIAAAGFKTVICNRPDEEGEPHLTSTEAAKKADALGMAFKYLPVNGANITDADVAAHAQLLDEAEGPVLTYCRTGTRCTKLWAIANAPEMGADTVIRAADQAGYDLRAMADRLK